ncbi:MAG: hypothetical protein ACI4J0_09105 [Huintestinicola sp.]|uniref:hypothetical protein n=1 Tax=Huintestinicola sp. TaxID=2981661 RepID=UPI003EFCD507
MKKSTKIISGILALSLVSSYAMPVLAAEKEEVIYVMADADGSVNSVYAVNSFDGGNITDYGDYTDVKLLNIDGTITQNGDEITFSSSDPGKVYYQGTLKNTEIPWSISIKYFLDGEELSAEDVAGKSGALEIKISITENEKCSTDFYENYALQCSFTLDTELCSNISADGATVANVGSKKQITYTVLPDKGLERSIFADVTDFEMAEGSINGIKMSLDLDIDNEEIDEKITDLTDGAKELDDGAKELYDGTVELNDGVSDLNEGIQKLRDGIAEAQEGLSELNNKSSELVDGSAEVKSALIKIQTSLTGVSANSDKLDRLASASAQIKSGIDELYGGIVQLNKSLNYESYKAAMSANGLDIDTLKAGNEQAISQLTAQITELKTQLAKIEKVPQYAEEAAKLKAQIEQLESTLTLLTGNNAALGGTETYLNSVSQASAQLESGAKELKAKYAEFDKAITGLTASLSEMLVNMSELSSGINTLVSEYAKLDRGIGEYTDGVKKLTDGFAEISDGAKELAEGGSELSKGAKELMDGAAEMHNGTSELRSETAKIDDTFGDDLSGMLDSMSDDDYEVRSFVSEKNTEVDSVQFVIKTEAVKIPEAIKADTEPEQELTFWQKLLSLFGLM